MKIVVNRDHGGFSISERAAQWMKKRGHVGAAHLIEQAKGSRWYGYIECDRNDPLLVQVVEELGSAASGELATLRVVNIPDDVEWQIEEYDGAEWVAEKHRTW